MWRWGQSDSLIEWYQVRDFCSSVASGCASAPKIPVPQVSELNGTMSRMGPPLRVQHVRIPPHCAEIPLRAGSHTTFLAEPLLSAGDNKGKEQHLKPNKTHTPSSAFVLVAMGTPYMHRKCWSMQMSFLISSPQSFMLLVQQFDR